MQYLYLLWAISCVCAWFRKAVLYNEQHVCTIEAVVNDVTKVDCDQRLGSTCLASSHHVLVLRDVLCALIICRERLIKMVLENIP